MTWPVAGIAVLTWNKTKTVVILHCRHFASDGAEPASVQERPPAGLAVVGSAFLRLRLWSAVKEDDLRAIDDVHLNVVEVEEVVHLADTHRVVVRRAAHLHELMAGAGVLLRGAIAAQRVVATATNAEEVEFGLRQCGVMLARREESSGEKRG